MALTKTQINYLQNKLERVVSERITQFKKDLKDEDTLEKAILKRVKSGEIKLLPPEEIIKIISKTIENKNYYYTSSFQLEELISTKDYNKVKAIVDKTKERIDTYSYELSKAKDNALDKFVLGGVDIDTALAELDKVKV
jgi:hypothetical protein